MDKSGSSKKQMPRWAKMCRKLMENICERKWGGIQEGLRELSDHSACLTQVKETGWKERGLVEAFELQCRSKDSSVRPLSWNCHRDATLWRNRPALVFLWHSLGSSPWQGGLSVDAAKGFRTQQLDPSVHYALCIRDLEVQFTHPSYKVTNPHSYEELNRFTLTNKGTKNLRQRTDTSLIKKKKIWK